MPRRNPKQRKLWLQVFFDAPGATREQVIETLIRSIEKGDYVYPENWRVAIFWRNKEEAKMRRGEFTREMNQSAQSSDGFDLAVIRYLRNVKP